MIEGEDYLANFKMTDKKSFILNRSALKMLNWESTIGKEITYWGSAKGNVIGLMDDFHFRSLHHLVEPCAIVINDLGLIIKYDFPPSTTYAPLTINAIAPKVARSQTEASFLISNSILLK